MMDFCEFLQESISNALDDVCVPWPISSQMAPPWDDFQLCILEKDNLNRLYTFGPFRSDYYVYLLKTNDLYIATPIVSKYENFNDDFFAYCSNRLKTAFGPDGPDVEIDYLPNPFCNNGLPFMIMSLNNFQNCYVYQPDATDEEKGTLFAVMALGQIQHMEWLLNNTIKPECFSI